MNYVIGSGLSGLSYAYLSKDKNTILEKSTNFGGRIQSKGYSKGFVEWGAQFFSKEDPNIYNLIKDLKLEKEETLVSLSKFFVKRDSEFISIKNGDSNQLTPEEARQIKLFQEKILSTLSIVETYPIELIDMPFDKWYIENIGKESEWIINGMMRAITFTEPKNQSALYGIIVCGTFFSDCYSINGGLKRINEELIKSATPKIIFNKDVNYINFFEDNAKSLIIDNKELKVESKLVSAIPSNSLSKIIEKGELSNKLSKIKYNGCAVLIIETDKKVLNHDSGILYTKNNEFASVMIDESKYYNFESDRNVIGVLCPYSERPKQELILKKAKGLIEEVSPEDFNILKENVYYWDYGLPEFNKKTFRLQEEINSITDQLSNFAICGDFMGLPSLDACVESARKAAKKLSKFK